MASDCYFREGRFQKKDGDVEFDFVTIDGIGLCPFDVVRSPGGYPKRLNEIINLDCRPDDVMLATYPKCGTHWTSEILNMILQGKADYMKDAKVSAMLEALPNLDMLERVQSPRVLNTHLPYKWFPKALIRDGGKIIHTTRNPKDAYVSLFHHCKNIFELGMKSKHMTWTQFFDTCVLGKSHLDSSADLVRESYTEVLKNLDEYLHFMQLSTNHIAKRYSIRANVVYGNWFDYAKEIELAKKTNPNIYTVHYESMKDDPEREIKGIAAFLGVQLSDSVIKEIALKCEFQNLKKADKEIKKFPPEMVKGFEEFKKLHPEFKVEMYRKGVVGDWKNHFTIAQNEQFDALYEKEMKDTDIKVIF